MHCCSELHSETIGVAVAVVVAAAAGNGPTAAGMPRAADSLTFTATAVAGLAFGPLRKFDYNGTVTLWHFR